MRTQAYRARHTARNGLCSGCVLGVSCTFRDRLHQPVLRCLSYQRDEIGHGAERISRTGRSDLPPGATGRFGLGEGLCKLCTQRSDCSQYGSDPAVWFCSGFA